MRCPSCSHQNLPGADACEKCETPLAPLDAPVPFDKVETSLMNDPVAVLQPKPPVTVSADATLGDAIQRMIECGVGALLVTNASAQLIGVLTERDFLTKVAGQPTFADLRVRAFMTANPETVTADHSLGYALAKMDGGGYRHLPVVDATGLPVGVISVRDMLRHVTRLCKEV